MLQQTRVTLSSIFEKRLEIDTIISYKLRFFEVIVAELLISLMQPS